MPCPSLHLAQPKLGAGMCIIVLGRSAGSTLQSTDVVQGQYLGDLLFQINISAPPPGAISVQITGAPHSAQQ